ncbi:TPA: 4Fe-4S binding protein [Candidatus Woesearchaeota archaeon]|nr:4Fe-4S binding protein [Candidatus Woesearchaeota archaeon]
MVLDKVKEKVKTAVGKKKKHLLLETGAVVKEAGNSTFNHTGGWRALRPVWHQDKCTQCMLCWMYCPDDSIPQKDGKRLDYDLDFCKGCGICAQVCPFQAITMEKEQK